MYKAHYWTWSNSLEEFQQVLCVCVCVCVCVLGREVESKSSNPRDKTAYFSLRGQTFVLGRMWPMSPLTPR